MIVLEHVSKRFAQRGETKTVARDLSFAFPENEHVGLIGRNGAGKTTLLKMLAGLVAPDRGQIHRRGSISWPVGFAGSFHPELTGAQNVRFVARVYDVDSKEAVETCRKLSGLSGALEWPVSTYSAGMKSRLAFSMSMVVPFDTYLVDEITAVGDLAFRRKCEDLLADRLKGRSAVIVSHSEDSLLRLCSSAAVLEGGRLFYYKRPVKAVEHYRHLMRGRLPPWLT